jgi:tRNA/rRNA methyltransferase
MTKTPLPNIAIILRGTKSAGNIGSTARAMHNMGLDQLRLAAPQCRIDEESYRMACSGSPILERAKVHKSLKNAIKGLNLLIGTTGKTGGNRAQTYSPRSLAPRILAQAGVQRVGILFGPEDTGLVDDDLLLCQLLVRIPTDPAARSINLAQAVMLVGYELFLANLKREPQRVPRLASVEQTEAMYAQLEQSLLEIGFLHAQNARHMMFAIRRLLGRAGLQTDDVGILRGVARQIAWAAKQIR